MKRLATVALTIEDAQIFARQMRRFTAGYLWRIDAAETKDADMMYLLEVDRNTHYRIRAERIFYRNYHVILHAYKGADIP